MDTAVIRGKLLDAISKNVPLILGEVANFQDDGGPCTYSLPYIYLLEMLESYKIG